MSIISDAVNNIVKIANSAKSGYDQTNRWGPDYDCSSLVITAYKKAGVPLTCTYTGNMFSDMTAKGFKNVTHKINLANGSGLEAGDVLLNVVHHTAMCIGNGNIVQASNNEIGGVTGGKTGDQTGNEINIRSYYNFPWNYVLRYEGEGASQAPVGTGTGEIQNGTYTVKQGDSLWSIAEKMYGNGSYFTKIMSANSMTNVTIHVGQVLKIPELVSSQPIATEKEKCTITLPVAKYGDTGMNVRKIQALLDACGFSIPIDGDYGSTTKNAIESFQRAKNIPVTSKVDAKTYEALLS